MVRGTIWWAYFHTRTGKQSCTSGAGKRGLRLQLSAIPASCGIRRLTIIDAVDILMACEGNNVKYNSPN